MEKIKISTIIEIAGKPESHVKESIEKMIDILKQNKKITIVKKEIASINKVELPSPGDKDKKVEIFSTFADLELDFPNIDELMQFILMFMPSNLEIIEPETLKMNQKDLENSLNDLLGRLHDHARVIMEYQALRQEIERQMQNSKKN